MNGAPRHLPVDSFVVEARNGMVPGHGFGERRPAQPQQLARGCGDKRAFDLRRHKSRAEHVAGKEKGGQLTRGSRHGDVERERSGADDEECVGAFNRERDVLAAPHTYGDGLRPERRLHSRQALAFGLSRRHRGPNPARALRISSRCHSRWSTLAGDEARCIDPKQSSERSKSALISIKTR